MAAGYESQGTVTSHILQVHICETGQILSPSSHNLASLPINAAESGSDHLALYGTLAVMSLQNHAQMDSCLHNINTKQRSIYIQCTATCTRCKAPCACTPNGPALAPQSSPFPRALLNLVATDVASRVSRPYHVCPSLRHHQTAKKSPTQSLSNKTREKW